MRVLVEEGEGERGDEEGEEEEKGGLGRNVEGRGLYAARKVKRQGAQSEGQDREEMEM